MLLNITALGPDLMPLNLVVSMCQQQKSTLDAENKPRMEVRVFQGAELLQLSPTSKGLEGI